MVIRVKDIMSSPAVTIDINKTAKDVGKVMKRRRKGCVIVTKNGRPVGIISDSDLIKRVVAEDKKASKVRVRDIMSSPLITVSPEDDIMVAVRKMKKNNIHRLPVVERKRVVGVISLSDIAKTSPEMLDLLEYRLKMRERPVEIVEEFTSGICDFCGNYSEKLTRTDDKWICEECRDEVEWE